MATAFKPNSVTIVQHQWGGLMKHDGIPKDIVKVAMDLFYYCFYKVVCNKDEFTNIDGSPMIHGSNILKMIERNPSIMEEAIIDTCRHEEISQMFNISHTCDSSYDIDKKFPEQDECLGCLDADDKISQISDIITALTATATYYPEIRAFMTLEGNALDIKLRDTMTVDLTLLGKRPIIRADNKIDIDYLEGELEEKIDLGLL